MNREDLIFVALHSFDIGLSKINNLFKLFGAPSLVLKAIKEGDMRTQKYLDASEINTINSKINDSFLNKLNARLAQLKIFVVTRFSNNVPKRLKTVFELCNCYGLFCKGDLNALNAKTCAIVGSRTPDAYGKRVSCEYARAIAKAGATIVSGLAAGVDSIGHTEAIANNAKTIAVLGGGFNKIYPSINTRLADKIIATGGLLLSEYPPQMQTQSYYFPVRNRIIAALSDAVVITQFKVKSGAMHTKNYAVEYGIDLFIPVADIYRECASGNLAVIEELPLTASVSPRQVIAALKLEAPAENNPLADLSADEIKIVKLLANGEKHFNDIVAESGFNAQTVNVLLTTLKISGIIKELAGNFFSL